ncbi:MAG: YtxH domain-containing protein [Bacteroidales bacterium]|jgi:hypothetical protein
MNYENLISNALAGIAIGALISLIFGILLSMLFTFDKDSETRKKIFGNGHGFSRNLKKQIQ